MDVKRIVQHLRQQHIVLKVWPGHDELGVASTAGKTWEGLNVGKIAWHGGEGRGLLRGAATSRCDNVRGGEQRGGVTTCGGANTHAGMREAVLVDSRAEGLATIGDHERKQHSGGILFPTAI